MELLNSPGYLATVDHINAYPVDNLRLLSYRAIQFVKCQLSVLDTEDAKRRLNQAGGIDLSEKQLRNVLNTLTYIFRQAHALPDGNKGFAKELKRAALNDNAISALVQEWEAVTVRSGGAQAAANLLSIGKLIDMEWSAGIATRSKRLRNLNSAYVTLAFAISDPNGSVERVTVELSMVEFRDFADKMREIKDVLQKLA